MTDFVIEHFTTIIMVLKAVVLVCLAKVVAYVYLTVVTRRIEPTSREYHWFTAVIACWGVAIIFICVFTLYAHRVAASCG